MGVLKWAYNRVIKQNKNLIGIFIGETGGAKSYSGFSLGVEWRRNKFKSSKMYIINNYMKLLELLMDNKKPNIKKGDVVVYEELGINADNRKFWSLMNDVIRYVGNLCRNRNFIFLMNVPVLTHIDKEVRPLVHGLFESVRIDKDKRLAEFKWFANSVNYRSGKSYFIYPIIYDKNLNKYVKCKSVCFKHPPEELENCNINTLSDYERIKEEFNQSIYKMLYDKGLDLQNKKEKSEQSVNDIINSVLGDYEKFVYTYRGYKLIDDDLIKINFNVGGRIAKTVKKTVERRKGIGWGVKSSED